MEEVKSEEVDTARSPAAVHVLLFVILATTVPSSLSCDPMFFFPKVEPWIKDLIELLVHMQRHPRHSDPTRHQSLECVSQ